MENSRGAIIMVMAMLLFALEDLFIKTLSADLSIGVILVVLGLGGGGVFALATTYRRERLLSRVFFSRAVMLRNIGEMIGTMGFVTAIALTPLASASAILQANPLVVTLGAALFLGAEVGWRRWLAILIGFGGVLLIVQPGLDGFEPASLFAVQGVIGLAIRDLATRAVPSSVSSMQLSTYGFVSVVPVGAAMIAFADGPSALPQAAHLGALCGAIVMGVCGYYAIVAAMRIGDIAVVTPFRYSRLIFAIIIGFFVFGEVPDMWTVIGGVIIVASGLFTLIREARLRKQARKAAQRARSQG